MAQEAQGSRAMRALSLVAVLALLAACSGATTTIGTVDGGDAGTGDGGKPGSCPAASPPDGSPCSGVLAGTRCDYSCNDVGGPSIATCTRSGWSVAVIDCPAVDAGRDAPPPADAPFACGTETCGATQYCEHPCCGGIAPPCMPMPDSGMCPAGSHPAFCQPFGGGPPGQNCQDDPCTPPPPMCVDSPNAAPGCMLESGSRNLVCLCA